MRSIGKGIDLLVSASTGLCAFAILMMMIQIVLDVVLRNLFSIAIPGTTVLVTNYWMVAVSYLPLALTEKMNGHITVDMAVVALSRRVRHWIAIAAYAVSAVVVVAMAVRLWSEATKAFTHGTFVMELGTPVVIWPAYFFVPIGFGLYALVLAYRVITMLTGAESGLGEAPADLGHAESASSAEAR